MPKQPALPKPLFKSKQNPLLISLCSLVFLGCLTATIFIVHKGSNDQGRVLPASTGAKPPWTGIWGIWGGSVSNVDKPWYKGYMVSLAWDDIEPENNQFNFSKLDDQIFEAVDNGLYVGFKIYHGFRTPHWVYDNGVTLVKTDATINKWGIDRSMHPYYLDPDFKFYLSRMINKVAQHIDTYPLNVREKIIMFQGPQGKSSDNTAYEGSLLSGYEQYDISSSEWNQWCQEVFQVYYNAYKNKNPYIMTIFNAGNVHQWIMNNLPGSGRKVTKLAQMYQDNREMTRLNEYSPDISTFQNGWAIRAREESTYTTRGWWQEAPKWNLYWQGLFSLYAGFDIINFSPSYNPELFDLEANNPHIEALEFFSHYAGYKDPRDSHGVWLALRDGLDVDDTTRFPTSTYGAVDGGKNPDRYLAIVNDFAQFGAQIGDLSRIGEWSLRYSDKMNDVGYQTHTGNYYRYLYQHDPNGTSQGYWRVGPKDQRFGRFARGFNHSQGKDTMYFDIDNGFFFDQPLNGQYPVKIRVVYFDQGTGSWALKYDAVSNPQKTAFTVTKTNSGQWKERVVTITDGYFGNRAPNNTDLMLVNTDKENDIFHMIELTRETGNRQNCWGDGVHTDCGDVTGTSPPGDNAYDLDDDGAVGVADLLLLLKDWNFTQSIADVTGDGKVNALDFVLLIQNFSGL